MSATLSFTFVVRITFIGLDNFITQINCTACATCAINKIL